MREEIVKIYQYDELSPKAKEKAREWYVRSFEYVGNFWSESITEDATQQAAYMGFDVKNIYWRGFCSQGDGACLVGSWRASEVKPGKVREHGPQDAELQRIAKEFEELATKNPEGFCRLEHRDHYYHSNSIDYDWENIEDIDSFKQAAKDLMNWIYNALQKEWEYQHSDEVVADNIRSNEYEFTVDGKRWV